MLKYKFENINILIITQKIIMVRQSIRNAINRSLDLVPKYDDLSDEKIVELQYKDDCISKGLTPIVCKLKLKMPKKVNYKYLKGSPKMKYKTMANAFETIKISKTIYKTHP